MGKGWKPDYIVIRPTIHYPKVNKYTHLWLWLTYKDGKNSKFNMLFITQRLQ